MIRRYIGNDPTRAGMRMGVEATGIRTPPPRRKHLGNLSGLRNEKSAFLQHLQGGYNNPGIQRARYQLPTIRNQIPRVSTFGGMRRFSDRILDTRAVRPDSTFSKLAKLIK